MGKYQQYEKKTVERPYIVHPIWRGIGCVLIILIPLISFALAQEMVNGSMQNLIPIPYGLRGTIQFPAWVWSIPVISSIARAIGSYPNLLAVIAFGITILVILAAILTTAYAFLYRFIGPPRYTRLDAPPPKKPWWVKKSR